MQTPIPVIIVTGFLGCGKTSFLRYLLPVCGELGRRPALIVNEVGDVDVDGELLADIHAEQVRLVGGCVCCTLQSQLTQTVFEVLDADTCDLIIIECSGLSNPTDVIHALTAPALLGRIGVSHIVGLLDAGRASKVMLSELASAQIGSSNIVVLNKMDTLRDENKPELMSILSEHTKNAKLYEAVFGNIGGDALRQIINSPAPITCSCGCGHAHHHHSHSLPNSFCTVAITLPHPLDRTNLERILLSLPQNVIRAKGFAYLPTEGWQAMHKVFDSVDIYPHSGPDPAIGSTLVCIGQHLSSEAIMESLAASSPHNDFI